MTQGSSPQLWQAPAALVDDLATYRARAARPDELIAAEVDGSGTLLGLVLDARAMRLASSDLATGVVDTVRQAQADAEGYRTEHTREVTADLPDPDALRAQLSEITLHAERRMNEFSAALHDVMRRVGA